jgi:hypothetical protein
MWEIIFPREPLPATPYLDRYLYEDLSSFLHYLEVEGLEIIQQSCLAGNHENADAAWSRQLLKLGVRRAYDAFVSVNERPATTLLADDQVDGVMLPVPRPATTLLADDQVDGVMLPVPEEDPSLPETGSSVVPGTDIHMQACHDVGDDTVFPSQLGLDFGDFIDWEAYYNR